MWKAVLQRTSLPALFFFPIQCQVVLFSFHIQQVLPDWRAMIFLSNSIWQPINLLTKVIFWMEILVTYLKLLTFKWLDLLNYFLVQRLNFVLLWADCSCHTMRLLFKYLVKLLGAERLQINLEIIEIRNSIQFSIHKEREKARDCYLLAFRDPRTRLLP